MSSELMLKLDRKGSVAVVTFLQPHCRLTPAFVAEFNAALDAVENDESVAALVTAPNPSSKTFCSGFDTGMLMGGKLEDPLGELVVPTMKLVHRIMLFPLPTVALVSGHAVAGGFFLAVAHDVVLARDSSSIVWSLPEVNLRLTFGSFFNPLLKARVPHPLLRRMLLGEPQPPASIIASGLASAATGSSNAEALEGAIATASKLGATFAKGPGGPSASKDTLRKIKRDAYDTVPSPTVKSVPKM